MEEKLMELVGKYGLEALLLGLGINVLTGILKLPLKAWAKKLEDGSKVTRYIVFLPLVIGFALTAAYIKLRTGHMALDKAFMTLWLSSSSLSLTLYAIYEKMFPGKEKILKEYEIEENKKLIETLRRLSGNEDTEPVKEAGREETSAENGKSDDSTTDAEESKKEGKEKIILRGKRDEKAEAEKKSV